MYAYTLHFENIVRLELFFNTLQKKKKIKLIFTDLINSFLTTVFKRPHSLRKLF